MPYTIGRAYHLTLCRESQHVSEKLTTSFFLFPLKHLPIFELSFIELRVIRYRLI